MVLAAGFRVVSLPGQSMKRHSHRRQIVLFLAAVILPCLVLLVAGIRMVGQQRELAEARLLQERSRVARQLGEDVLTHLNEVWALAQPATDSASWVAPSSPWKRSAVP